MIIVSLTVDDCASHVVELRLDDSQQLNYIDNRNICLLKSTC